MAFGKKNQKQYRAPTSEPDGGVVGVIIAYKALPKWSRQLMSFAGCIAGMAAFGLAYHEIGSSLKSIPAPAFDIAAPRFEVVTDLPIGRVTAAVATHNHALRGFCLRPAGRDDNRRENDSFADTRLPRMDPDDGIVRIHPGNGGPFLACVLSRETARFCVPSERARVVAALSKFAVVQAEYARLKSQAPTNGIGQLEHRLNGKPDEDDIQSNEAGPPLDGNLARALQKVTKAGYLTAADFGRKPPIELLPYIVKSSAEPCKS